MGIYKHGFVVVRIIFFFFFFFQFSPTNRTVSSLGEQKGTTSITTAENLKNKYYVDVFTKGKYSRYDE